MFSYMSDGASGVIGGLFPVAVKARVVAMEGHVAGGGGGGNR